MPEKLVYIKPSELKEEIMSRKWLQDFGSYNHMPNPYTKIEEFTFADVAKRGTPDYIEYRMIESVNGYELTYLPVYIYWYTDGGLMVLFDHLSNLMEFYLIGCVHDFDEKVDAKGRHDLTCKVCGYQDVIYDEDIIGTSG